MLIVILIHGCFSEKRKLIPVKNGIQTATKNLNVRAQYYDKGTVRVTKWPSNGTSEKNSLSVIMDSVPELEIKIQEAQEYVLLESPQLLVKLFKKDGHLQFVSPDDSTILSETGKPEFTPVVYDRDSAFSISQSFSLYRDEGVYGLGQHQYGYFNYRGKTVKLVQTNTDAVIPFLISTHNYGILWDNYSMTIFKDDEKGASL